MDVQLMQHTFQLGTVVNECLRRPVPPPNAFDACLENDYWLWDEFLANGQLQKICCPKGRRPYTQKPWIAMPREGRQFKKISTIDLPAPPYTLVDVLVLADKVPTGHDGVIKDVVCELTAAAATGFVEGSGEVVWRLSAQGAVGDPQRRFLRDMGDIQMTLGSLIYPSPQSMGGWRVFSDDDIIFSVAIAAGAEANLNPQARITCSISGWYYPR